MTPASALTLSAGKAYLRILGDEVKPFYGLDFNDGTYIKSIDVGQGAINAYNLHGQQIPNVKSSKGVVILNNKKVVNK